MLRYPILRFGGNHKIVSLLKKFLNELVKPSPNLSEDDDTLDAQTLKAVGKFKKQWYSKLGVMGLYTFEQVDLFLWKMIGKALGKERLEAELKGTNDYELRSLLLGMDAQAYGVKYYTREMEACDAKIAGLFGGKNAIAGANGFEPDGLALNGWAYYRGDTLNIWVDGTEVIGPGHISRHVMHLYGSTDGTRLGVDGKTYTDVYIPDGFEMKSKVKYGGNKDALTQIPTPEQNIVRFYYKKVGNVTDATLMMMHIKDFKPVKEGNRWKIGRIGGNGGQSGNSEYGYLHSHFLIMKGDEGLALQFDRKGNYDMTATGLYRESKGIRFVDAFC